MDLMPLIATLPLLSIGLSMASAAMFGLVARTVARREVSADSRPARDAFVLWWGCLALVTLFGAALALPGIPLSVPLFLSVSMVSLAVLCVGLWGLLSYLLALHTSRRGLARPLAVGYVLYFVFLATFILAGEPNAVVREDWGPELDYADPIDSGPLYWAAVLLLLLPPLFAAAAYLSLYWRVDQAVQKRRILLVSISILVWFSTASIGTGVGEGAAADWWRVVSRLVGLAAAGTIYYAYRGMRPARPESQVSAPGPGAEPPLYAPPRKGVSQVARIGPAS